MPDPFNYALNVPNPAQAILQGVQIAGGIADAKAQQAQAASAQLANDRKQAFNADVAKVSASPSAAGYASLAAKYPEAGEVLKESYNLLNAQEQQERIGQASNVYSAIAAGKPELAQQFLTQQAEAYRTGGREKDAKQLEDLAKLVEASPETAQTTAALFLATNMGPKDFVEGFSTLESNRRATQREGAELSEAEAKAQKAAVDAKFAESNAVADLKKKGWDVQKIQNDIEVSRANSKIAALNAQINKETNETRKQELQLKLQEFQDKRDATVRQRTGDSQAARFVTDNLISNIDDLLKKGASEFYQYNSETGKAEKTIGANEDLKRVTGTIDSRTPTFRQKSKEIETALDSITGQIALANIDKLKGSTSDKDVLLLRGAIQGLQTANSGDELVKRLSEVRRLALKSRQDITTRYGMPETIPDRPNAEYGTRETDDVVKRLINEAMSKQQ